MPNLMHYFYSFISYMVFIAPLRLRFLLGDALGILWFDIVRLRRQIVLDNLAIVFPDWGYERKLVVGRQAVCNLGRSFIEFLMLPHLNLKWMEENVLLHGIEHFYAAQNQGKGVLCLSLHLGNGDLAASMLSLKGLPVFLITKRMSVKWIDNFWFRVRTNHGTRFIEPRDSTFDIFRALRQNGAVIFVLDQYAGKPIGIKTKFFGRETGTIYSLALFAHKTKAPVLPLYTFRDCNGKTNIVFEPEIDFEEKANREQTLLHMTQIYNRHVEKIILKHPEQWLWVHRRWKEFQD